MNPELNYSLEEKEKIREWKNSLPVNNTRKFAYVFEENGKLCKEGYNLCDFLIKSNDKYKLVVSENISL